MRNLGRPTVPASHAAAGPAGPGDAAVLSRINHDMRSPLSVILGTFEVLAECSDLDASDRRFLSLGTEAAEALLRLADDLRLYAALQRGSVSVECVSLDLARLVAQSMTNALQPHGFTIVTGETQGALQCAAGDLDYLCVAVSALARHLTGSIRESVATGCRALSLCVTQREGRCVAALTPADGGLEALPAVTPDAMLQPGEQTLGLLNAVRLMTLMEGTVNVDADSARLTISLPSCPTRA
jgi:hypothetical protein